MDRSSTQAPAGKRAAPRGQVATLTALALGGILAAVALAVDVGYWRDVQRHQQIAADSAAMAAAAQLAYPASTASPPAYVTAARNDSASNGFTHDGVSVKVTVNNPPSSGAYVGNTSAAEVIVAAKHPSFFAGPSGMSSEWVTTRAVGLLTGSGVDCIYALNPSGSPYSLWVNGGSVNAANCNIIDNGSWDFTGGTINAQAIGVAGSVTYNGGTYANATPAPSVEVQDPCQTIPACASLTNSPPSTSGACTSFQNNNGTLNQGLYCKLVVNGGGTVTLNSGTYVITGQFKQSGGVLNGNGVTFYIANGGSINLTGGTANLTAPTTGAYSGVLFYQVATNTTSAQLTGNGGVSCPSSTPDMQGVFYAPNALLDVTGGGWDPSVVIVNQLEVTGGSMTCLTPLGGGFPNRRAVLAE